ncbi:hypothetical protein BX71_17190 [Escherichia coli O111:NM str. 2010C-4715]|nr:hypothetical protein BX71_17190 [Escherichia coli O111:NM str. 2010C-4715]
MVATRLNSIQIMRGIAALIVVAFHIRYNLSVYEQKNLGDLMFSNGEVGVYLFFCDKRIHYITINKKERVAFRI